MRAPMRTPGPVGAASMRVAEHAEPVDVGSGRVGVVLSHGFTGSPQSVRPWAEYLADNGLRAVAPRLPGHGTDWRLMNRTGWPDWYARVERAFLRLADECDQVVVAGQSMGGALALKLAAEYGTGPARVAGIVLVNPSLTADRRSLMALPLLRRLVSSVNGLGNDIHRSGVAEYAYDRLPLHALASLTDLWRTVEADLPRVRQPVVVFRSPQDHVVSGRSVRLLRGRVGSARLEEHVLPDSYHVATLDYDAPTIFAGTLEFVRALQRRRSNGEGWA